MANEAAAVAVAAQEELKFDSDEKKAEAINGFDENAGKLEDLEKLMNAPVVKPEVAPEDGKEEQPPQAEPEPEPKEVEPAKEESQPQSDAKTFNWDEWAKSKGYKTPGEARKAFDEKQKFIEERLSKAPVPGEGYEALVKKNKDLEAQLNASRAAVPATAPEKAQTQAAVSNINTVKEALNNNLLKNRGLISRLKEDASLAYDPGFLEEQQNVQEEKYRLDMQMVDEITTLRNIQETTSKQFTDLNRNREEESRREQGKRMYESEMNEIQSFASNATHPELNFTKGKDSKIVEGEYVNWASKIASAVYGSKVNMIGSEQEKAATRQALELVRQGDPEAIAACNAAGISTEPSTDVRKYLDICELLDHRDGLKMNPVTGKTEQQYRTVRDPITGEFRKDPVRFASLEDAYNHKLAVDGTFQKRIKDAYSKGSKDFAKAAAKRASGPVVLPNSGGASSIDVGLQMTPKQAMDALSSFDEVEAQRRRLSGDNAMFDQYNKAMDIINKVQL